MRSDHSGNDGWLTSWYQQNANQPAQKQGQYSKSHTEPDNSSVQMF